MSDLQHKRCASEHLQMREKKGNTVTASDRLGFPAEIALKKFETRYFELLNPSYRAVSADFQLVWSMITTGDGGQKFVDHGGLRRKIHGPRNTKSDVWAGPLPRSKFLKKAGKKKAQKLSPARFARGVFL